MIKKISLTFVVLVLAVGSSLADVTFTWGTATLGKAYASDGITLLPATGSSATAGFCQLLYIGLAYDGIASSGNGTMGDDVVLQTSYVGTGAMSFPGTILGTYINSTYAPGSQFMIRFFDTASPNYGAGLVPTTGNYGMSQVYLTTQVQNSTPASESFLFNANYSATTAVVPEPSTVALMLAGLGVLGFRRIRRK